ncbi:hypothetical protein EMIHUDRAFT_255559 [Emiliania huxleyi CCMP1516]|uniref:Uncharacterized protein n=2 Tax=Emiliania huxleyi TaxID=2903 RepID=A0A0D3J8P5_EMIH1|nr:hypothetical protein EMIHUDRAFT_255559 [Emiliania huxleyi CCMP1516]EOD19880.1 hypothetical protein EMIHUDRAFT_255559 [Emiliania huxleyi CCMP1516]|eukprot:XP_005772309.1 hypothetical protein EMIHUDRAFT_255559 [Emiliania huxleyi CCMP1516]
MIVLRLMYHYNNPPDAITYTALAPRRACELLQQMRREDHGPSPTMLPVMVDSMVAARSFVAKCSRTGCTSAFTA